MNSTFVLDGAGVNKYILNADYIFEPLEEYAKNRAIAAYGNDYHMIKFKGTQRAHVIAFPNTKEHPS